MTRVAVTARGMVMDSSGLIRLVSLIAPTFGICVMMNSMVMAGF